MLIQERSVYIFGLLLAHFVSVSPAKAFPVFY